ncbi:MAG: 4-hydroxy-tetrahydrodipicolinate synthase [Betaproteobacteria bacterium]|nr:4-hydroxy-tetrahydrodipicolinate synthase [Betaproteobacteria bacterium]
MPVNFSGVWIPIVTPFCCGGVIDHAALACLARHLAGQGIAGFVAGATTGEGALLHPGEQEAIFDTLRGAAPELPVVLGVTQFATEAAVAQARSLAALRPDGLLVTPPSYLRPSQQGIRRHFEALAQAADLPLLIYNIPYRTGVTIELETLQALATDARIAGIKECGGGMERMQRLINETPLRVLTGDDNQIFMALCLGADGAIAAAAHVRTELYVRMFDLLREGQLAQARRIHAALASIVGSLFAEPNPAPLKAWLASEEWCEPELRLPFVPASLKLRERLLADWAVLQKFEA